jgi:hypothetical protein
MTPQLQLDDEGHNVLSACLQYWSSEPLPEIERVVCYSWVRRLYRDTFGVDLKRAAFDRVGKLGLPNELSHEWVAVDKSDEAL